MHNNNRKNSPYGDETGEIISWVVIFIFMFAFWPIGLLLLIKRLRGQTRRRPGSSRAADVRTLPRAAREDTSGKAKKLESNPLDKKSGRFAAGVLLIISVALFIFGANTIIGAAWDIRSGAVSRWPDLFLGVFYFIGGFITFFTRNIGVRRYERYKKYHALVSGRDIVAMCDIAKSAGRSVKAVGRDLQGMISSGYFGSGAYIDSELKSLVLSAEAAAKARRAASEATQAAQPSDEVPENQYMAIITQLRDLNATIVDIIISDKIDRIEGLTAKIFRIVEDEPAKLPKIRRFMDYYLPTTLKLLRSYATLEKQGIKGENITAAKENIGRILDTLATGYEQQLDQLFKSDVIDIAADINVLENMMRQDGLSPSQSGQMTMGE